MYKFFQYLKLFSYYNPAEFYDFIQIKNAFFVKIEHKSNMNLG